MNYSGSFHMFPCLCDESWLALGALPNGGGAGAGDPDENVLSGKAKGNHHTVIP